MTVYDDRGSFDGTQSGWFAKEILNRFNIRFNIVGSRVPGPDPATMAANYDLLLVGGSTLKTCIASGQIIDMTNLIKGEQNIAKFDLAARYLASHLGAGDKTYGLAANMTLLPPTAPMLGGGNPPFGPYIRWDYYKELGYPAMNTTDDLLTVLGAMQTAHPMSTTGKKVYGISIDPTWDGIYPMYPAFFAYLYGWQLPGWGYSFAFINADATKTQGIMDDGGVYYRALEMLFKANQMGLLDPDSEEVNKSTYFNVEHKVADGAVLFQPTTFDFQDYDFVSIRAQKLGFALAPVGDMTLLASGPSPYPNYTAFAISSRAEDPQRLVDFLDWYCSPEGVQISNAGPEGLTWAMQNGKPVQTSYGQTASAQNSPRTGRIRRRNVQRRCQPVLHGPRVQRRHQPRHRRAV